jgi:superoxide dismutase, Cu-Zn family
MNRFILMLAALAVTAAGTAAADWPSATATLKDAQGKAAGTATFTDTAGVVQMKLKATGLTPGKHGIHVHEVGKCDGDFKSAGAHYNPHGKKHGGQSDAGAHAGDLPNLTADADGKASLQTTLHGVTLEEGAHNSLLDKDGSALVIHAKEDDERTDPSGNSGDRVVCGVLTRAP